jgi:diguanylate cyclase (GGDEF)-like protein
LTISIGVSNFPFDAFNLSDLVKHADEALYRAKAGGRNKVVV